MLLEVVLVFCAFTLSTALYRISRDTWYIFGMTMLYNLKFYILGAKSVIDDLRNAKYNKTDIPLMSRKIAIVTGGSRGIGASIVRKLLQCDMEIIIACRTIVAGEKTIQQIREAGITSGRTKVYKLDNSCLQSVREFTEQIKRDYDEIHILINNAGVMFIPYRETKDGFEEQWAVNYLSHFLLTSLLLPLLKTGGKPDDNSRIINVTSCAHILSPLNFDDINGKDRFLTHAMYALSKFAQVVFTIRLQKLLKDRSLDIRVYSVHPGIVKSNLFDHTYLGKNKWLMTACKKPDDGAISIVYAAVNKSIEKQGGIYISNCKETPVHSAALEPKIQEELFELSLKQTQLDDFFQCL